MRYYNIISKTHYVLLKKIKKKKKICISFLNFLSLCDYFINNILHGEVKNKNYTNVKEKKSISFD